MSKIKIKDFQKFVTPAGQASMAFILKPSTKFNKDGMYSINLAIPGEGVVKLSKTETVSIKELLNHIVDTKLAEVKKEGTDLKVIARKRKLTKDGELLLKFKLKAIRKDKKTGEVTRNKLSVVGANGKTPFPVDTMIGEGTVAKVCFTAFGYSMVKETYVNEEPVNILEVGVSLQLRGVQILDLVEFDSNPFEDESDEYDVQVIDNTAATIAAEDEELHDEDGIKDAETADF